MNPKLKRIVIPLLVAIPLICYLFCPILRTDLLPGAGNINGMYILTHLGEFLQTASQLKQLGALVIAVIIAVLLPVLGGLISLLGAVFQKHKLTLWGTVIANVGLMCLLALLGVVTLALTSDSDASAPFFSTVGAVLSQLGFGFYLPLLGFATVSAYAKVSSRCQKEAKQEKQ